MPVRPVAGRAEEEAMAETAGTREEVRLAHPGEGVALVTVSGPPPCAATFSLVEALAARLAQAREGGARVTVVASDVPGHWIGHASLRDLLAMFRGQPTSGDGASFFRAVHELAATDVVTIAAVSGDCAGGGAELAWACDLRVAAATARFSQPEVPIGVTTGLGGASRLARLVGCSMTAEMVLDGGPVAASRLHALGVVHRVVDAARCTDGAVAWALRLASRPAAALAAQKRALRESLERPLAEALVEEQRRFQENAHPDAALSGMARVQARYDAGAQPDDVFDPPFEIG
jgi:enoyl-CoA hydratase/carnithine racemase